MSFTFIPFYIHFMGIESYGLVGFFMSLQAVLFILDLGLTATVSRELARLSVNAEPADRMRALVRTLELVYWGISLLICLGTILLSQWLAGEWLQSESLPKEKVAEAIMLMGFVIAARMPFGFYCGGLMGLQHQVLASVVKASTETVRNGGVVLVLWLLSPDITAFFLWQVGISVVATCVMGRCLWRSMPESLRSPRFDSGILRKLYRFAAGMSGIALVSILLMQMDKIILSKMLSLETFGYYTVASVVGMSLFFLATPIVSAYAPKLTQLASADECQQELIGRYHQGCQLMAVVIFPVAVTIALFSSEILLLWTQDANVVDSAHLSLSLLVTGTALNSIMNIPYSLQVAYGWTRLAFVLNLLLLMLQFPLLIIMTQYYGVVGAASVWLILNIVYVLVGVHMMHMHIITEEKWKWCLYDVLLPLCATVVVAVIGRYLVSETMSVTLIFISLVMITMLSFLAALFAAPLARGYLFLVLKRGTL
ncbi:MAG: hypothetical protein AUJ57_07280 [Zetaproteobacteria bacterium CG1_02_53_45]|nr:MAG: hypothetical protein AUJ57_07280 [Zetaproteobacteria bacterium CG1_02_53_45]